MAFSDVCEMMGLLQPRHARMSHVVGGQHVSFLDMRACYFLRWMEVDPLLHLHNSVL
jgi:hypothetical protein